MRYQFFHRLIAFGWFACALPAYAARPIERWFPIGLRLLPVSFLP